jgi:tetratricopeptide (TPR) repeat protein
VVALAGVTAIVAVFRPAYRAEAWRNRGRETIDQLANRPTDTPDFRTRLGFAQFALDIAVALDPTNAQAWSDRSYAIALRGLAEKGRNAALGKEAESAANRALALSGASYEFWVRRGGARDMQGRWLDAGNDFAKALEVAPNNSYAWYYYADHLYRNTTERGLADAALAFCLRLDPGNQPGLALRQRLAISPQLP